ncbi:MAG: spore cortex biosynthesis protein YabQ [Candidatus Choladocola sp.]|nr:spore cortex biosynthesis protein YabQ [Candidatus Choladocola sp.]
MSRVISQEAAVFLLSVLHGAGLTFLYDLIRAFRRAVSHNLFVVSAEDFLFWLAAGFFTFCLAFSETDGVIRGYVAAGIAIGAVFYHFTFSGLIVRGVSWLFRLIGHSVSLLCRILAKPVEKIWIICKKIIEFARKKGYNVGRTKKRSGAVRPRGRCAEPECLDGRSRRGRKYGRKKKTAKQK